MSETNFRCVKCGELLLVLAKGSKYADKFRAVCDGCLNPAKAGPKPVDLFELLKAAGGNKG